MSKDGGEDEGELTLKEFASLLGPLLGFNALSTHEPEAIAQLFMKIDADCGGTVDWCQALYLCPGLLYEYFAHEVPDALLPLHLDQGRIYQLLLPPAPGRGWRKRQGLETVPTGCRSRFVHVMSVYCLQSSASDSLQVH